MAENIMKFRILGPLELALDGRPVPPRAAKPRALLALLLLDLNRVRERDWLIEQLWSGRPPQAAAATLRAYVYQLRKELSRFDRGVVLRARAGGYALEAAPESVDAHDFASFCARGREALRAGGCEEAAAAFRTGLDLWRGSAFAGIDVPAVREKARILDELRIDVTEQCLSAELELETPTSAVAELEQLTAAHPLREGLWRLLMLGLYRAGRPGEALEAYQRLYRLLDAELAIAPSPEVERLHRRILDRDPILQHLAVSAVSRSKPVWTLPRQLPAAPAHFTGRAAQLSEIDDLLSASAPGQICTVAVIGTGGIGKTALTLHWAHRVADRFPDGQLYVNMRGFDPTGSSATSGEAVRAFLSALGVPPEQVPSEFDAQIGLYRSLLADKRVLVVLDNARDAEQVRPLLPGQAGTLAVVTSRNRLSGLIAQGAHPIPLGPLDAADAARLLGRRLRGRWTAAAPEATEEIITACAGLPLALTVVIARAAANPRFALAALAADLREAANRFDALAAFDPAADIRAVFSWSYRALSAEAARMFRLLSTHPGPDFAAAAAAAATGTSPHQARRPLAELACASLLVEQAPGRFAFHDLVRDYAADLAAAEDGRDGLEAARRRVLDYYLHTAYAGHRLLNPIQDPITLAPAAPGVTPESLDDGGRAMNWFVAEHAVLLAAVHHAAAHGLTEHCWQLAWAITDHLHRSGNWHDLVGCWEIASDAVRAHGDGTVRFRVQRRLAMAYSLLERFEEAHALLDGVETLCRELDDRIGQGHLFQLRGYMWRRQGRYDEALACNRRALDLYRAVGHQGGQAIALNSIGWHHVLVNEDYETALSCCEQALDLARATGDRAGQAATLDSLGHVHLRLGQYEQAITHFLQAVDLGRELAFRTGEAAALVNLGDAQSAIGDGDAARDSWRRALEIFDDLGHPDADQVRAKLARKA